MTFVTPELQSIQPEEWHFYGLWKQDIFSACFWQSCFDKKVLRNFGFEIENGSTMIANGGNFFYHKPTLERVRQYVAAEISNKRIAPFKQFSEEAKSTYLAGIDFAQKTVASAPLTPEYFEEFLSQGRKMSLYWWFAAVHLALSVENLLQEKVVEYSISAHDVINLIPKVDTPMLEQQKGLIHLKNKIAGKTLEEIKQDVQLFNELELYRKKYAWIETANWIGEELTFDRLITQIKHAEENIEELMPHAPPEVATIAECLGYIGYAKQAGAEYVAMYEYLTRPYLERLAAHMGLTYREMLSTTHDEIKNVLRGGENNLRSIADSETRKNMRWMIVSTSDNQVCVIENEHDSSLVDERMVPHADMGTQEIKGETGNRGKATGTVRVIINVDDFHKMQPKDVLVTTMTTPDFVILMQKASAIVTDIGGMLCHAAIIAREIHTPCIIGTRFATQILKDGDVVEVDADAGVVKIIKSSLD